MSDGPLILPGGPSLPRACQGSGGIGVLCSTERDARLVLSGSLLLSLADL